MRPFSLTDVAEPYTSTFGDNDQFGRKQIGQSLSDLVERIEDPLVIGLDGSWGSGKTWFLRRWVGSHSVENGGSATTIYFDAFANDFLDDPLIGLTAEVLKRLPQAKMSLVEGIKNAAYKLSKPATRVGLALASAGLSEIASPVIDAGIGAAKGEIEEGSKKFWEKEAGRSEAMVAFRAHLVELTKIEGAEGGRKLVFVIDELDRCRPDYALAMLETIKHFFAVDNVHFVLGANFSALQESVKARYGSGIDAYGYLKRFISLRLTLPEIIDGDLERPVVGAFTKSRALDAGLGKETADTLQTQLSFVNRAKGISMRDCQSIISRIALIPKYKELESFYFGYRVILVSLVIIQVLDPLLYSKLVRSEATLNDVKQFFGLRDETMNIEDREKYDYRSIVLFNIWTYILDPQALDVDEKKEIARQFGAFGLDNPSRTVRNLDKDYINTFKLT